MPILGHDFMGHQYTCSKNMRTTVMKKKKNNENKLENILIIKKKGFLCKLFPVPLTNLSLVRWLVLRITVKEYKKYSLKNG